MSEDSKPVIFEAKTARLMDIISETEKQFGNQISPPPGEVKRLELIRKMKQDIMFCNFTLDIYNKFSGKIYIYK